MDATTMTQTFDQWFQLRLDSLRRQNEWRKIDCLLASKEYVRDAWEYVHIPDGHVVVPVEPTRAMVIAGASLAMHGNTEPYDHYRAMLSAAPKETK